ncbi:MAG: hypothetical protein J2P45_07550, partial [Candidatus Dormibacteraeota bacterium]|nr:hypothetical protein [Candidatus Dormibacteraeota bacterium]
MRHGLGEHLTSPFHWFGAGRDRTTGSIAVAMVGTLMIAAVIAGVGSRATLPQLSNVGAWLGSPGQLVHVNGLSGRPDGRVTFKAANGHPLKVVQDGTGAYVVDLVTGQVSRIDPGQLAVGQVRGYGTAGVQVVAGSKAAYVVDPKAGLVLQINPTSLAQIGRPISLPAPLGEAGLDSGGTLWVPDLANGSVVSVRAGKKRSSVAVGSPRDQLDLTMAGGNPVVTDISKAVTAVLGSKGAQRRVNLPSAVAAQAANELLVPAVVDGSTLPLLSPASAALVLVDLARGAVTTVPVTAPGHELGTPQALGRRVYVPDQSAGSLVVYDAAAGKFDSPVTVTGKPATLDAFVQDGQLWVNDQNGPAALVVDPDGSVHDIGKYDAQVPGNRPDGPPAGPPTSGAGAGPAVGGTGSGGQRTPTPPPTIPLTPATPPPPPQAPGPVTAKSGPGYITVTFTPPKQGKPTGYSLVGAPAGATVQPAQVPAGGPFTFQVTGGSCAQQYSFAVAAQYTNGTANSAPSVAVRPCVAPGAPQSFTATAVQHGANLSWSPPANAGSSQVTYNLTGGASRSGMAGTSLSVGGLTNFTKYSFALTASNGAGTSGQATTSVSLTGPRVSLGLHNRTNLQNQQTQLHLDTA